ncbi:hypothetical protein BD408DRAFT_461693 [Parasitella parasitica]|nr:hypothetical protein BD408DRAFT_461693 [Parasitella parasitica]
MKYLKNKFAALETLMFSTNAKNPFEAQTEEDYAEWWNQMAHLCQKPLQSYNINISEFKTQDYLYHIQGSVKLFDAIAPGPKKLTIDITSPFDDEDDDKMIPLVEMKQSKSRVGLFDSRDSEKFLQNVDFVRLYERLQPFSPNIIRVLNNGSFESHSWEILSCIIALIGNKAKSVAHFHGMVFANPVDAALMQQKGGYEETSVATLKFSNCKIYADVFSKLSPQLSKVDTMIIDNCDIPASSLNQLEINLAATQLCRLELKLKGIGCSTIIVTTDTSEQTYYQHDEIKDNSFIYIRCKELQSLIISGKKMF